eukprot:scaffold1220_cov259-Pinguiococcus_pyrenoidosus.AAC.53
MQVQTVCELFVRRGVDEILLVRKDEHGDPQKLVFLQQLSQLHARLLQAPAVCFAVSLVSPGRWVLRRSLPMPPPTCAVDDVHQSVGLVEVVPPVGTDGLLAADVPHIELELGVHEALDVEALGRHDVVDVFVTEKQATARGSAALQWPRCLPLLHVAPT